MKRSRRELSFDMAIHVDIFKLNQITLFPCFNFRPKTGSIFTIHFLFFISCVLTYVTKSHGENGIIASTKSLVTGLWLQQQTGIVVVTISIVTATAVVVVTIQSCHHANF